jgi:type IV secretory pathway VirB3-like protein
MAWLRRSRQPCSQLSVSLRGVAPLRLTRESVLLGVMGSILGIILCKLATRVVLAILAVVYKVIAPLLRFSLSLVISLEFTIQNAPEVSLFLSLTSSIQIGCRSLLLVH